MTFREEFNGIIEFGLLGHPLKYSRPYIQRDDSLLQGEGKYESPEGFRLNNQGAQFAKGQDKQIAQSRKAGVISVGTRGSKGGWKAQAVGEGLTKAKDAKRSVIKHELIHSIQRAKSKHWDRKGFNPISVFANEIGAYSTQHRGMKGRTLADRAFPTLKAIPGAISSTNTSLDISNKLKRATYPAMIKIASLAHSFT